MAGKSIRIAHGTMAWALAVILAAGVGRAEEATEPGRWVGRVDEAAAVFAWPGSGFVIAFEGRRLVVTLDNSGDNALTVRVGEAVSTVALRPGLHDYVLVDEAEAGRFEVRAERRTEGSVGPTRFVAAVTDGRLLPPEAPSRSILVLGDSISAGYGIEGDGPDCGYSPATQNHDLTFAARLGRAFDADVTTLAVSGIGLVRNYADREGVLLPQVLDLARPDGQAGAPPPAEEPDVVVVHVGTNDFSGGHRPDGFSEAYADLLGRLRSDDPDAAIVVALGGMLGGDDLAAAREAVEAALAADGAAGGAATFAEVPDAGEDRGCDWHPDAAANARMAVALGAEIARRTGWQPRPDGG